MLEWMVGLMLMLMLVLELLLWPDRHCHVGSNSSREQGVQVETQAFGLLSTSFPSPVSTD